MSAGEVLDRKSKGSIASSQKNQHRGGQGIKIRRLYKQPQTSSSTDKNKINRVLAIERKGIIAEITYCTN